MERGSVLGVQAKSHPSLLKDWRIAVTGLLCSMERAALRTVTRLLDLRVREFLLLRRIDTQREILQVANRIQWEE